MPAAATVPAQADQAALEAETDDNTYPPPDLIKHSLGVAKARCRISDAGLLETPNYNITSIADTGTGDRTIDWATDFSTSDVYVPIAATASTGTDIRKILQDTYAVGSVTHRIQNDAASALIDMHTAVAAFGDQ